MARTRKRAPVRKPKAKTTVKDALPTIWNTYDRATGTLTPVAIVEMADTHVLAAIAYCERRAAEYARLTHRSPNETAAMLWPGYRALVVEAARRFGTPSLEDPVMSTGRVVIMKKEDET